MNGEPGSAASAQQRGARAPLSERRCASRQTLAALRR